MVPYIQLREKEHYAEQPDDNARWLKERTHIIEHQTCTPHDANNAMKNAVKPLLTGVDVLLWLHIMVEGLRKCFSDLVEHLLPWIAEYVTFSKPFCDREQAL